MPEGDALSRYLFHTDAGGGVDLKISVYDFSSVWQGDQDPRAPSNGGLGIFWTGSMMGINYTFADAAIPKQSTPMINKGERLVAAVTLVAQADLFTNYTASLYPPAFSPRCPSSGIWLRQFERRNVRILQQHRKN